MFRRQLVPAVLLLLVFAVVTGVVYPVAVWAIGQVAFKSKADGSFIKDNGVIVGSSLLGQNFSDQNGNPLPQYFQPRPSDAGTGYNAMSSGASNLGPGDPRLVGFIPGLNTVDLSGNTSPTNVFATAADPNCVPLDAKTGNPVASPTAGETFQMSGGSYVCDPNTVPERTMAYLSFNDLPPGTKVPVDAVTASGSGLDPAISVANADLQAPRVAAARHLSLNQVMGLVKANTQARTLGVLGEETVNVVELNMALDHLQG
ncbi:MAG TPA: potassium-transporting ATPase subunit C [Actinomycetota bacterium]|nr:potassium-transporting ATPase subunit C [Actinomycetota bacterium]